MQKKILKTMMCAAMAMALLVGCGNSNTQSTTKSTECDLTEYLTKRTF